MCVFPRAHPVRSLTHTADQVQHLIERCLLLYMDRDDCVKALAKYAHVKPVITLTGETSHLKGLLNIAKARHSWLDYLVLVQESS